jgi:hypothetical protein
MTILSDQVAPSTEGEVRSKIENGTSLAVGFTSSPATVLPAKEFGIKSRVIINTTNKLRDCIPFPLANCI